MLLTTQEQYNLDDGIHFHGDRDTFDVTDMSTIIGSEGMNINIYVKLFNIQQNNIYSNQGSRPEDFCDSNADSYNLRWAFNRATFKFPNTPHLLSNVFTPNVFEQEIKDYKDITYFKVEPNGVYDFVLQNYPACDGVCETHPIHLHGHSFWLLGSFTGLWQGTQEQINALCKENCPIRDTAWLIADKTYYDINSRQGCGYTVIRLIANSPGVWPIHCHQSWHFLMGKIAILYYDSQYITKPNITDIHTCGNISSQDIYPIYYPNNESSTNNRRIILELSLGLGIPLLGLISFNVCYFCCNSNKKQKRLRKVSNMLSFMNGDAGKSELSSLK